LVAATRAEAVPEAQRGADELTNCNPICFRLSIVGTGSGRTALDALPFPTVSDRLPQSARLSRDQHDRTDAEASYQFREYRAMASQGITLPPAHPTGLPPRL
jgi:DNA-binding IclR family transcriptional regulator